MGTSRGGQNVQGEKCPPVVPCPGPLCSEERTIPTVIHNYHFKINPQVYHYCPLLRNKCFKTVNICLLALAVAQTISHTTIVLKETSSSVNSSVDTFSLAGLQLICLYISTMHCNDWPGAAHKMVEGQLNHVTTSITILNKSKKKN